MGVFLIDSLFPKFSHRAEGDSISVELHQDWNDFNFIGFAIGFVAASIPERFHPSEYEWAHFDCALHVETRSGQIDKFAAYNCNWMIYRGEFVIDEEEARITSSGITSDRVFISYYPDLCLEYSDAVEASFYLKYGISQKIQVGVVVQ